MNGHAPRAAAFLAALGSSGPVTQRVALVVAHPDDDIIAAAGQLARLRRLTLIHATAGAPGANGDSEIGRVRKAELAASLSAAAAAPERQFLYDLPDGGVMDQIADLVGRLIVDLSDVDVVMTHPFEGGHTDHDACAFAVWRACEDLARTRGTAPDRVEFSSYYSRRGKVRAGAFWEDPGCPALRIDLAPDAMARRVAAFACHRSQDQNLRYFYLDRESFRRAPDYDFAEPPPPKATLYGPEAEAQLMARIRALLP